MAYLRLEDLHGSVETIVFPDLFKSAGDLLQEDVPLLVQGTVDKNDNGVKIKATRITHLSQAREKLGGLIHIRLETLGLTTDDLKNLREIILEHPGDSSVILHMLSKNREYVIVANDRLRANPQPHFVEAIETVLGRDSVEIVKN
jgi:DNA polymerase-3 subunit alpha